MNYYPTPLNISTMTGLSKLNCDINLKELYDILRITNRIKYIEVGPEHKGYSKKNDIKKRKKKLSKTFYNQLTIIVYSEIYNKNVNVKLFNNGKIQFTGLKNKYCAEEIIKYIITIMNKQLNIYNEIYDVLNNIINKTISIELNTDELNTISTLNRPIIYNKNSSTLSYDPIRIVLINSDFDIKFPINREVLHKIVVDKNIFSTYEPCIYPGVNIKYYFNKENKLKNGICSCISKCNGKGNGIGDGNCKRITICVFQSGKAIITGAQYDVQLIEAFIFIKKLILYNAEYIKTGYLNII